ncbi:glycosyltransferase [Rhizobium grahamii]|nr:glycosyltransferase [Rhizobium grahamii]
MGSARDGASCGVRIAVLAEKYDVEREFRDVLSEGIEVREFSWKRTDGREVEFINKLEDRSPELLHSRYYLPEDGIHNLMDTDFWLVVSDRTDLPLAPVKPYAVFATDYIQRYVPEIFPPNGLGKIDAPFIQTVRGANAIIVTTPQTMQDAISYAGVPAAKVHLAPMDFDPTAVSTYSADDAGYSSHFVWPTNPTQHKNHKRAYDALERYYTRMGGRLKVKVVGPNTHWLDPEQTIPKHIAEIQYIADLREQYRESSALRENVEFCGELPDEEYSKIVSAAQFLWHPVLYDNGTFAVAEAALMGCPSLSSGYPQMRYIGERFGIPMKYFDARSVPSMVEALKAMEGEAQELRRSLPDAETLSRHSWERHAADYWRMVQGFAA